MVVADDQNLETAETLGFATVSRDNVFLGRRFNDGIQLALDPDINPRPADYVVPFGSDDWVDHRILLDLPEPDTVHCFRQVSFVNEDASELTPTVLSNEGGCGIRVYPAALMRRVNYRPADEYRPRACDTSILLNLKQAKRFLHVVHKPIAEHQIVDWKTSGQQLNSYQSVRNRWKGRPVGNPFELLAGLYPKQSLRLMETHYQ